MLIDKLLTIGLPVALSTAAPATSKLGDEIDLLYTDLDQGEGHPMYLCVSVAVAATSGGAATLALQLVTASDDALTADVVVLASSATFALADLTPAGTRLLILALPKGVSYDRYLGLRQVVGGVAFTGGSLNAFITADPDNWRAYPEGQN